MRRGLILGLLAAVLLAVAWWFFLISPRNGQIDEARSDLRTAQEEETLLRTRIRALEEIRDAEVEYLAAMGRLDTLIPSRPLLEEFIEQINDLADQNDILLRSLAPSVPAATGEESPLREISINAQIDGQFFDVIGFLFGLTDLERLVRVDAISASSASLEGGETILSVSLELRLFTLADLIPIPDIDIDPGGGPPPDEDTEGGDLDTEEPPAEAGEALGGTVGPGGA
jgi:Tfp pilus assembly protein PilO